MSTSWYGSRVIELINARSLFIKVWPAPINLTERRAVLRALQRYGDIEVFKRLTEPDTFICAPTRADTASALVRRSPLTFKFISESLQTIQAKASPTIPPYDVAAPVIIHEVKNPSELERNQRPETDKKLSDLIKTFTLRIEPSQNHYEHKPIIRRKPLHGPWPKSPREDEDFAFTALKQVLPMDLATQGLCDWHTGGQLVEDIKHVRVAEETAQQWQIRERLERRKARQQPLPGDGSLTAWGTVNDMMQQVGKQRH